MCNDIELLPKYYCTVLHSKILMDKTDRIDQAIWRINKYILAEHYFDFKCLDCKFDCID